MPTLKQDEATFKANLQEVADSLLPAVMRDCAENITMISLWLKQNATSNDVVDASVTNIRRAVEFGQKEDLIVWDVPPVDETAPKLTPTGVNFIDGLTNWLQIRDMQHDVYKKWALGPHSSAFKQRIREI